MTNTQLFLSIGIPSVLIVLAWLNNNSRLNRVEDKIDGLRKEMFDEFKQFYMTLGQHDGRLGAVEKRSGL